MTRNSLLGMKKVSIKVNKSKCKPYSYFNLFFSLCTLGLEQKKVKRKKVIQLLNISEAFND